MTAPHGSFVYLLWEIQARQIDSLGFHKNTKRKLPGELTEDDCGEILYTLCLAGDW
jgi:hypothetical protein